MSGRDSLVFLAIVTVFAAGLESFAQGPSPFSMPVLPAPVPTSDPASPEYEPDSVIVKFTPGAEISQRQRAYDAVVGGPLRAYGLVPGLEHVSLGRGVTPEQAIERLRHLPFVDYVEPNYIVQADADDPLLFRQWGLDNTGEFNSDLDYAGVYDADIDAPEAWGIATGNPDFVVAVIDTGVDYTHEDLVNNIWTNPGEIAGDGIDNDNNGYVDDVHGWDFHGDGWLPGVPDNDPFDTNGHGTHVGGTICAHTNNGIGVAGVAWRCKIMALRFIGPYGGDTADAIAAIDYAVAMGAKVSNNSWGGTEYSQALRDAIAAAGAAGHLFIAAAGNSSVDADATPHYPAAYDLDNIVSVAATDAFDEMSSFSNYGAISVDIGAPGTDIGSTYPGNSYVYASGTSMAAPHVTGLAALIWDLHPLWTAGQVRGRILESARPLDALAGKTVTGGIINAFDALYDAPSGPPDGAPESLSATAVSSSQIDLTWTDGSTNEDGFVLERSDTGAFAGEEQQIGLPSNTQAYSDTGLAAETTYFHRIKASNSEGDSAWSNTASATTDAAPAFIEVVASGETPGAGTVNGSYQNTHVAEGTYLEGTVQAITERLSGGPKPKRHSYLEHTWSFSDVPTGQTELIIGWAAEPSSDGDGFVFSYSLDGVNFVELAPDLSDFPQDVVGNVAIRVNDTDQTEGRQALDTVEIDYIAILSHGTSGGTAPAAPTSLAATASGAYSIDLGWSDNSSDELGFQIQRSPSGEGNWTQIGQVGIDVVTFQDTGLTPVTSYDYQVRAYNNVGHSNWSDIASATTGAGSGLTLTVNAYKDKGWHYVDLTWEPPNTDVDIYRDGDPIASGVGGGSYLDGPLGKGGATYVYEVCPAGSGDGCVTETVNF